MFTYSLTQADADFSISNRNGENWLMNKQAALIKQSELKVHGGHNLANILACLALGRALDLPMSALLEAALDFSGLPHRCEWVAEYNGVNWFNDSKGTNVGATLAALHGLSDKRKNILLIAGGDGKGADFSPLGSAIEKHVKVTILIGMSANEIAGNVPDKESVFYATSLEAAVSTASRLAHPGDTVLLSPACASFDMFEDFADRGDVFKRCVTGFSAGVGK